MTQVNAFSKCEMTATTPSGRWGKPKNDVYLVLAKQSIVRSNASMWLSVVGQLSCESRLEKKTFVVDCSSCKNVCNSGTPVFKNEST